MRTLTDAERIASVREALEAACGDWHAITPILSVQADLNWLLERAASPPPPDLDRLREVAEEVDSAWYDEGDHIEYHPELAERLLALRAALSPATEEPRE
jgi:hypothetical protein